MKRFGLAALLCALLSAAPALAWHYGVGPPMPHRCYAVGEVPGLGLLAGSYEGNGMVYVLEPDTLTWRAWRELPVSIGHESVSYFVPVDGGAGVNIFTEDHHGPECYTAWAPDWRVFRTPAEAPRQSMYALGGPESAAQGWAAISAGHGRKQGGVLAAWDRDAWRPFTFGLWLEDVPALIWTAARYSGRILAGASVGTRDYLAGDVGLLAEWAGDRWRIIPAPVMAGVVRLTQLESDPGALYLSTTHGEIWRTTDLASYELYHRGYGEHGDAWVFELDQRRVVVGALGQVWEDGALVLDIPGVEFMTVAPTRLANDDWCLAGPVSFMGESGSRPLRITPGEKP